MENTKGITLISLIVTILVLIILTGVSINIALEDNGILETTKKTKENIQDTIIETETKLNELKGQDV